MRKTWLGFDKIDMSILRWLCAGALVAVIFFGLAYLESDRADKEWELFVQEHSCKKIKDTNWTKTYICDDGVQYTR